MKQLILFFLTATTVAFAQERRDDTKSLFNYARLNYKLPSSVISDCNWNYAVVRVVPGKTRNVIEVNVLNDVSEDFRKSFDYLKQFRFPPSSEINDRPVIFMLTVDQSGNPVCGKVMPPGPSVAVAKVMAEITEQMCREPKTIVIYEPIFVIGYGSTVQ